MKIYLTSPRTEFIKQFLLNRAMVVPTGNFFSETTVREATNAWALIEKELKKEMEKSNED